MASSQDDEGDTVLKMFLEAFGWPTNNQYLPQNIKKSVYALKMKTNIGFTTKGMGCAIKWRLNSSSHDFKILTSSNAVSYTDIEGGRSLMAERYCGKYPSHIEKDGHRIKNISALSTHGETKDFVLLPLATEPKNFLICDQTKIDTILVPGKLLSAITFVDEVFVQVKFEYNTLTKSYELKSVIPAKMENKLSTERLVGAPVVMEGDSTHVVGVLAHVDNQIIHPVLFGKFSFVPLEVARRGAQAVVAYKKAIREGKIQDKHIPIVIVGQERSGKTSLKKNLTRRAFEPNEASTISVDVELTSCKIGGGVWEAVDNLQPNENDHQAARVFVEHLEDVIDKSHSESSLTSNQNNRLESLPTEEKELDHLKDDATPSANNRSSDDDSQLFLIPDEVAAVATNLSQKKEEMAELAGDRVNATIWDFAGQEVFYVTHPVFMRPSGIFIVTNDLSKDPNAVVHSEEQLANQACGGVPENCGCFAKTNLEYLDFWMASIASLSQDDETNNFTDSELVAFPEKVPAIFMVHTFADKFSGNTAEAIKATQKIEESFEGKAYQANLVNETFIIDNTKAGKPSKEEGKQIKKLRKTIQDVVIELLRINQENWCLPLTWYQFEKEMLRKRAEGEKIIEFTEGKEIAVKCGITDDIEISTMLDYFHDRRTIIYFSTAAGISQQIFLDPQWLIDVFKRVITLKPKLSRISKYRKHWDELARTGTLSRELAQHEWQPLIGKTRMSPDKMEETVDNLLNIMEKFGLICRWQGSGGHERFLVPSMLKSLDLEAIDSDIPALFVRFESVQVPLGFFNRLTVEFINWFAEDNKHKDEIVLKHNAVTLSVGGFYSAALVCLPTTIKVIVRRKERKKDTICSKLIRPESETCACQRVVKFLRTTLSEDSLKTKFPWNRATKFGLYVMCNVCSDIKEKPPCEKHSIPNCKRDECCHWLSEKMLRDSVDKPINCARGSSPWQTIVPNERFAPWFAFLTMSELTEGWWHPKLPPEVHPNHPEVYPMKKNPRGKAVILNNKNFKVERLPYRYGSEVDVQIVRELFSWLRFEVDVVEDLEGQAMRDCLKRYTEVDQGNCDCFVACLMSHGEEDDIILGTDDVGVKLDDVCSMFSNGNCTTLAGKPKCFLVQACRGPRIDQGVVMKDGPLRGSCQRTGEEDTQPLEQWKAEFHLNEAIADRADIIMANATVKGYVSFINILQGSRFINSVDQVFRERAYYQDLLDMLTLVSRKVNETGRLGTKQVSEGRSTLTKKLYFWPDFPPSQNWTGN